MRIPERGGRASGKNSATPGTGGTRNFDPKRLWAKQREERTKTGLGVTDEEWKKRCNRLVDAVQKARWDTFGGGGGGFGRRQGGGNT